jgi:hypothetical protein
VVLRVLHGPFVGGAWRNLVDVKASADWIGLAHNGRNKFGREQAATVRTPHHADRTHLPTEHSFINGVYMSIIL